MKSPHIGIGRYAFFHIETALITIILHCDWMLSPSHEITQIDLESSLDNNAVH